MPSKNFEQVVHFIERRDSDGNIIHFPIVEVTLITSTNAQTILPLLFDTGASFTTLSHHLYPLLGLNSWDQGQRVHVDAVGGRPEVYQYIATFEIFGKTINCPIHLAKLNPHPLFQGLLGRDTIFDEFGFGFWESTRELYVTTNP